MGVALTWKMAAVNPPPPPDPVFTFRPRSGAVQSVQYVNFNGKESVLTGMSSGLMSLWDLRLKRQFWIKHLSGNVISSKFVHCNEEGCIVSMEKEGKITLWSIDKDSVVSEGVSRSSGFCGISIVSNEGPRVLTAGKEFGKLNVFNFATGKIDTTISAKDQKSRGMSMCVTVFECNSVKYILAGFEDGKVSSWDIRSPLQELSTIELFPEPVMCVDYNTDTRHGVCGSALSTLETFTINQDDSLCKKYSVAVKNDGISSAAIRRDGKIMASGGWDGRIRIFGCKKGKPLAVLNHHTDVVQCIDFAPPDSDNYSNILICGSKDQRISLWKIY